MHNALKSRPGNRYLQMLKYPLALFCATLTTVMLLYLMQYLIDSGADAITGQDNGRIVEFIRLKEEPTLEVKKRKAKPPPLPDEPPPPIAQQVATTTIDGSWSTRFSAPTLNLNMSRTASFYGDGEYMPILKVQPIYPQRALLRGMFGWVVVQFTVDDNGRVVDPVVIENCVEIFMSNRRVCLDSPGRIFDKPAIEAAAKFKYKPKIIDGNAIATSGVKHLITFELSEMRQL